MSRQVLLVRHTQVALAWRGRCYGHSDMGLSRAGAAHARILARQLAQWAPDVVLHSGLRRTRILAEAIAAFTGLPAQADPAWMERDFGDWEGRSWAAIWRETGNAMDGMIDDAEAYRPGDGETTMEMAARAIAAWQSLPARRALVITHGGPIAAIIATRQGTPVTDWPRLVPATGACLELP
ncbi:histidine phosphatase family protein [Blastomonas sp. AAP53]|uniref:histidine phosphatase family protein n=1 Tax=Blastomonas sp. AAP53 TaxID=1248760 RepID=UPI00035CD013|nr:histidine phosphatase family protein [Blastomonas sp. AAP53]